MMVGERNVKTDEDENIEDEIVASNWQREVAGDVVGNVLIGQ